ncbi:Non-functional NADPH-dependent codeinone reductase 2 [Camellia lanceoleosa]|uniref:Non-functional NADPH-dependent codeinone reductase 2 n=1 Tax=Camellia lanceoleosa TaxID=1840588 RepID=A0ACC0IFS6_9ERIC|nr:Non-functional NADPH-dependent codeinone reductase 2 [Camellia lanceoleosa]
MKSIPEMLLCCSSDHKPIPLVGFGTAVYPLSSSETMKQSILHAIKLGYRHFDSATLYQSEQPLGESIFDAIRLGFIQSRQDLFITSKLWCSDAHPHHVLPALQNSLKNLGLEYLDLYLIHWPVSSKPGKFEYPVNKQELPPMDFKSVWEAMEECQNLGLTKFIGVSNFSCKKLQLLLATVKIPPAVNQVEMNPLWQQKKLREFCEKNGIHITAYSPLGAKGTIWGSDKVMECEVLKQIAKARGKSVAQVCLRWVYEQGVGVLVKSFSEERMKENLQIFDWELSAQDSEMINQISHYKGCAGLDFISDEGPYKSLQDLWDGEIV